MDERFPLAEKLKGKGNDLFRAKRYKFARARYERLLRMLESTRDYENQSEVERCVGGGGEGGGGGGGKGGEREREWSVMMGAGRRGRRPGAFHTAASEGRFGRLRQAVTRRECCPELHFWLFRCPHAPSSPLLFTQDGRTEASRPVQPRAVLLPSSRIRPVGAVRQQGHGP